MYTGVELFSDPYHGISYGSGFDAAVFFPPALQQEVEQLDKIFTQPFSEAELLALADEERRAENIGADKSHVQHGFFRLPFSAQVEVGRPGVGADGRDHEKLRNVFAAGDGGASGGDAVVYCPEVFLCAGFFDGGADAGKKHISFYRGSEALFVIEVNDDAFQPSVLMGPGLPYQHFHLAEIVVLQQRSYQMSTGKTCCTDDDSSFHNQLRITNDE